MNSFVLKLVMCLGVGQAILLPGLTCAAPSIIDQKMTLYRVTCIGGKGFKLRTNPRKTIDTSLGAYIERSATNSFSIEIHRVFDGGRGVDDEETEVIALSLTGSPGSTAIRSLKIERLEFILADGVGRTSLAGWTSHKQESSVELNSLSSGGFISGSIFLSNSNRNDGAKKPIGFSCVIPAEGQGIRP